MSSKKIVTQKAKIAKYIISGRANGHTLEEQRRIGRRMVDFNTEAVKTRLSKFSSAEGKLAVD